MMLLSSTHPRWFAASSADLQALLSDHLHCERKAAENALSLVRRYPHRGDSVDQLARLAHEETSHVIQVGALLARRGWTARADTPNHYARGAARRGARPRAGAAARRAPGRGVHRSPLARAARSPGPGFAARGEGELAGLYDALAGAEERHAEIFLELAPPLVTPDAFAARLAEMAAREAEIVAGLPHVPRVH